MEKRKGEGNFTKLHRRIREKKRAGRAREGISPQLRSKRGYRKRCCGVKGLRFRKWEPGENIRVKLNERGGIKGGEIF